MDSAFLKEQAMRCRSLAENADQFTKRRLLDLAEKYDDRSGRPSRASRTLGIARGRRVVAKRIHGRCCSNGTKPSSLKLTDPRADHVDSRRIRSNHLGNRHSARRCRRLFGLPDRISKSRMSNASVINVRIPAGARSGR
jgi:hypothetical protein